MFKFTLTEINYLLALAQTRNFSKAAKQCKVSQPALSIAINKLETKLGVAIFERKNLVVSLTDLGEQIVSQAHKALVELHAIETIAATGRSQTHTPFKVGAIFSVAPYLFPKILPTLHKLAPHMPLIIQEDYSANLKVKLLSGELDAAIISLPFDVPGIVTKPLYKEAFVLCARKDHPLAKGKSIHSADLKNENILLVGTGHCFKDQVLQVCNHCYNAAGNTQVIEGASLETLKHMVASGLGVTILPESAAETCSYHEMLCTRPFADIKPEREIALAWRVSFPRTKAINTFLLSLPATCNSGYNTKSSATQSKARKSKA